MTKDDIIYIFSDIEDVYESLFSFKEYHRKDDVEVSPGIWCYEAYYSVKDKRVNYYYSNNKEALIKFRKKLLIEEL